METGLHLLMRDGPVQVAFSPHLATARYEELLEIVKGFTAHTTSVDLARVLESAAKRWGVNVTVRREKV